MSPIPNNTTHNLHALAHEALLLKKGNHFLLGKEICQRSIAPSVPTTPTKNKFMTERVGKRRYTYPVRRGSLLCSNRSWAMSSLATSKQINYTEVNADARQSLTCSSRGLVGCHQAPNRQQLSQRHGEKYSEGAHSVRISELQRQQVQASVGVLVLLLLAC